ncbi:hypothetical protein [Halorhodospira halophila]|uniref:hypothetical protein n=1 Tax=Halorhodospira halophila TaxID=1053 RepID=UPI0019118F35|nr:hypothetical protein [Halorhodospira halophila]MBK5942729.1 hypothetical protein [Halorhodospira halophila]
MIDTGSARIAIIRATMLGHESAEDDQIRYGHKIQKTRAANTAGSIAHGICAGEILAEVDRQREPVRSWLYIAYAEPPWEWITYAMLERVHLALRAEWRERCGANISDQREAELLRTALNDKRRTLNDGDRALKPGDYTRAIGIPRESWSRHYREYADAAKGIIDDWDREGRGAVAAMLRNVLQSAS